MIETINPATGKLIKTYEEMSSEEINHVISQTDSAYKKWKLMPFMERAFKMKKAAELLKKQKEKLANIMTLEMGKPIAQSRGEVEKCAWVCDYFAENAESFLNDVTIETGASKSYVAYQPLGVVFAIMPWNFPLWQVFRFAAPSLMAGNAGILKHSPNVTGTALAIEKIFDEAGFPDNLFRTIVISVGRAKNIIEHEKIRAVTLTGSVPAGKAVAAKAGAVLKKTVLELGGSDPYLVLEDADLENTVETCVASRMLNSGQSCIAAKRFIVVQKIYKRFEEMFVEKMKSQKMGDPFDESNDLGPQARLDLRDTLHKQVTNSIRKGAKILLGGEVPLREGAYYPPTVLTSVSKGMPAYEEELFGPVASLIKVKNMQEGIEIANDTSYGLGAAVFTQNIDLGERIAKEKLQAGCCFVNDFVKSDPRLPFGGIKNSGYGRELSFYGIREFVNIKTISVK